jgi:CobQ-like glutamine amidotransferase family enzyme
VVLGVCAGFQILGNSFPAPDGSPHPGLGLLDVETHRGKPRAVGEALVLTDDSHFIRPGGDRLLSGFENHGGRTTRAPGTLALGRVTLGVGNGDGTDGAVSGRVFATYLHGPVLARNPELADSLLGLALGSPLDPLDNPSAEALHQERVLLAGSTKSQRVARGQREGTPGPRARI